MVPVTYLFVVLFGEGTWASEFAFAAWHRSARSTIELEGTALASRYVLLCEWGESATKFTSMWASRRLASEARFLPSQVVDRVGRIVPPPLAAAFIYMYRLTGGSIWGSFAKACHGKCFYSAGFLIFLEQQGEHEYYSLTKNQERTTLPLTTRDRQRARVKRKMYVNQRRDEMSRTWKHILRHEHFRAKYRYVGVFSNAVFNHFLLEDFSQTNGNRLVGSPRAHFRQKLKINKI